jgi:hypothetical protein
VEFLEELTNQRLEFALRRELYEACLKENTLEIRRKVLPLNHVETLVISERRIRR